MKNQKAFGKFNLTYNTDIYDTISFFLLESIIFEILSPINMNTSFGQI